VPCMNRDARSTRDTQANEYYTTGSAYSTTDENIQANNRMCGQSMNANGSQNAIQSRENQTSGVWTAYHDVRSHEEQNLHTNQLSDCSDERANNASLCKSEGCEKSDHSKRNVPPVRHSGSDLRPSRACDALDSACEHEFASSSGMMVWCGMLCFPSSFCPCARAISNRRFRIFSMLSRWHVTQCSGCGTSEASVSVSAHYIASLPLFFPRFPFRLQSFLALN